MVDDVKVLQTVIGTNSISMAAPGLNADSFNLDMATSAVSRGTIEMQQKKHLIIPSAWADSGSGALCPLGGTETNSSYKGYGLAVLVEVLCGILSGATL
jgi:LDH2 family malate/lactate/ureidoglycolate dehydrogenase